MYEGKEVCQGCRRAGNEYSRPSKNELCRTCKDQLNIGRARQHEDSMEYTTIRHFYHSFGSINFNDRSLNNCINNLLSSLNNPNASPKGAYGHIGGPSYDNSGWYIIPSNLVEPLSVFALSMDRYVKGLRDAIEDLPETTRKALRDEKNRIYNEGVEKGRDLLFSLNNGDITMEEFGRDINRH